jgi:REP element-mobilizing transposase RayT
MLGKQLGTKLNRAPQRVNQVIIKDIMPVLPRRKLIRLQNYDYSTNGYYFLTFCTRDRKKLFGKIEKFKMKLNDAGKMIDFWWSEIPVHFSGVQLDQYVIMPDHVHAIINIVGADRCVRAHDIYYDKIKNIANVGIGSLGWTHRSTPTDSNFDPCFKSDTPTVSHIIQWFKTMTTNEYIRNVKTENWPRYDKQLWQRSFHDHIIRHEIALMRIRKYIYENPMKWKQSG